MLTCFLLEAHEAPRLILAFVLQGIRAVAAAGLWRGTGLPVEPREAENARLSPPFRGYSSSARLGVNQSLVGVQAGCSSRRSKH
ncbi:unnamed protein product [Gadus morhua 'NCC']